MILKKKLFMYIKKRQSLFSFFSFLSLFAFALFEQALAQFEATPVALYDNGCLDFLVETLFFHAANRLEHFSFFGYLNREIGNFCLVFSRLF